MCAHVFVCVRVHVCVLAFPPFFPSPHFEVGFLSLDLALLLLIFALFFVLVLFLANELIDKLQVYETRESEKYKLIMFKDFIML